MNTEQNKPLQLSPTAAELLRDRQGSLPVYIRSPKSGTEFYTGLSRAKLYQLASAGKIRSVSIRQPGQTRGTRLFLLASIVSFLESCGADPASQSVATP